MYVHMYAVITPNEAIVSLQSLQIPPILMSELGWGLWPNGLWGSVGRVKKLLPVHDPSLCNDVYSAFNRVEVDGS